MNFLHFKLNQTSCPDKSWMFWWFSCLPYWWISLDILIIKADKEDQSVDYAKSFISGNIVPVRHGCRKCHSHHFPGRQSRFIIDKHLSKLSMKPFISERVFLIPKRTFLFRNKGVKNRKTTEHKLQKGSKIGIVCRSHIFWNFV